MAQIRLAIACDQTATFRSRIRAKDLVELQISKKRHRSRENEWQALRPHACNPCVCDKFNPWFKCGSRRL